MWQFLRRTVEVLLWGFSLFIAIPPVRSIEGQRFSPARPLMIGCVSLGLYFAIRILEKEEAWAAAALKIMMYAVFVTLLYKCVNLS